MTDTELMSAPDLVDQLRLLVGEENVLDEQASIMYSQDVFEKSEYISTVVRPRNTLEVSSVVNACTSLSLIHI